MKGFVNNLLNQTIQLLGVFTAARSTLLNPANTTLCKRLLCRRTVLGRHGQAIEPIARVEQSGARPSVRFFAP